MARSIRTSRMLIGLLGVTVSVGVTVFYIKSKKSDAKADPSRTPVTLVKEPGTARPDEVVAAAPIITPPLLAAVTTIQPTTRPSGSATTQPAAAINALPMLAATTSVPATPVPVGDVLATAAAKQEAGELIAARKLLYDALASGKLPGDQIDRAKQQITAINETVVFSSKKFSNDPFATTYTVKSGDRLSKIATRFDITVDLIKRINNITDERKLQAGKTLKIIQGPFTAVVNRSTFTIDLYIGPPGESGSMFVRSYRVALGKDNGTPPGGWMVEAGKKQKNPKFWGAGGLPMMEADDPQNPLGEYWIGLTGTDGDAVDKQGYGIHGTIDPDSIGKQASMGCIRLINEEAAVVFELLCEGKSMVVVK